MTIKLYNSRKAGIISKEVAALKVGDLLVVDKIISIEGRSVLHIEVADKEVIFEQLTQERADSQ